MLVVYVNNILLTKPELEELAVKLASLLSIKGSFQRPNVTTVFRLNIKLVNTSQYASLISYLF